MQSKAKIEQTLDPKVAALEDFRIAVISRQASYLGRREVLSGKAKFGIFGDGKEVAQVALARFCQPGDWRSGYYRDQTMMLALGNTTLKQFFAQLYADSDLTREPASGGRQMNGHFASRLLEENGTWKDQLQQFNVSADLSPTAGQMARMLGLGYASKLYREQPNLKDKKKFSVQGNEVTFGTIGNASTSEGLFWETLNAAGVLQVPIVLSVWDDEFGISVPNKFQTVKGSISEAAAGFAGKGGIEILVAKGWDYPGLIKTYGEATRLAREHHQPVLVHVIEMTQPQGHSTSGSHERYKTQERLQFESAMDPLSKMKEWMVAQNFANLKELEAVEQEAAKLVEKARKDSWDAYQKPILEARTRLHDILAQQKPDSADLPDSLKESLQKAIRQLKKPGTVYWRNLHSTARSLRYSYRITKTPYPEALRQFDEDLKTFGQESFSSHLLSESPASPLRVDPVLPEWDADAPLVDGREVIQGYFSEVLERTPELFIVGEDVGKLGGVNLEFDGLQEKFGPNRVTDTGIREATILGQGIGSALRGLRPIVDIQYLDYLLYCIQGISDDLATTRFRTRGGQAAPVIVRTKGHRLEGIWHTGSPIAMILGSVRGCHLCVPRNSVQAAGMYGTLLKGDDPGIVIEVLNGYRVKEKLPKNLGSLQIPLGSVEVLQAGSDITVITYGACIRIALAAAESLQMMGISLEIIDVQTLLPFDLDHAILQSLMKTNALIAMDEDVPGGATAFMLQESLEVQNGYDYLDAKPRTLTAKAHRSGYGSDADYYSKPSKDDLVDLAVEIMVERDPTKFAHLA